MKGFSYTNPMLVDQCEIPMIRFSPHVNNKKEVLISISGGLGDRICAEPTVRFLANKFSNKKITLVSITPDLFAHLPIINLSPLDDYDFTKQPVLVSYWHENALSHKFLENLKIHAVDYMSINLIQSTLPTPEDKVIHNKFHIDNHPKLKSLLEKPLVLVHPGISWPSKTLPRNWYVNIVDKLSKKYKVAIIGRNDASNTKVGVMELGDVDAVNLVNELTVEELGALAKEAHAIVTNDSSPLHIASAKGGKAKIAYISFIKSEPYLNHWRVDLDGRVKFGWRMKNFAKKDFSDILYDPINRFNLDATKMVSEREKVEAMPSVDEVVSWIESDQGE